MKIKEYFKDKEELTCKCGCGQMPDTKSIEMLYALRIIYGFPIIITSGARCKRHNDSLLASSSNSAHLQGAFDIVVPKEHEWRVIQIAQFVGFNGIGFKDNSFIHIDRYHNKPAVWGY